MYLRHTTVTKNGKTHTYWRLVRSVRVGSQVRQETVAQLGELDAQGRVRARALAEELVGIERQPGLFEEELPRAPITVDLRRLRLERGRRFGDVWLAWRLWQAVGMEQLLERLLRVEGYYGVVAFSDPVPRHTAAGPLVFTGHLGTIYQAFNARYLGRSRPRIPRLLPDGTAFSDRAASKIRAGARGWRYAARQLIGHGADAQAPFGPADFWAATGKDCQRHGRREWLAYWLARLTRPLRHGGCHRYAWTLQKRRRVLLLPAYPYPKRETG